MSSRPMRATRAAAGRRCCPTTVSPLRSAVGRRRCLTAIAIWRAIFSTSCIAAAVCSRPSLGLSPTNRATGCCCRRRRGRHTPIDPTMLEVPDVADYGWPKQDEYEVRVKHAGGHSSIFYHNDPMKVVGWKGDLFPFKLNVRNILPIMSDRIHVPPSSWVTFEAPGFVVLSIPPQIAV